MNEEIDEYDIYHQDFTTVSEWEVFIARIEEVLNDWKLPKVKLTRPSSYTKKWLSKTETIRFHDRSFVLSYHTLEPSESAEVPEESDSNSLLEDLHNNLWDSTASFIDDLDGSQFPVSSWYGLKRYLMLCPSSTLVEGSVIKLVMSSVNIAFANVDCGVPFFVKIREHWQHCYLGIYEDNEYKTSYDTIHLKRISNQCSHLSGLLGIFKSKIASPIALDAVIISAKLSYELKDFEYFSWKKSTNTNEFLSIDGFDVKKLIELPFGAEKNPISSALLNAIWPKFRESTIVDCSTYSDIDPLMAPNWTITLKMRDDINCQLSETINKMMDLLECSNLLMDTLGLSRTLGLVNPLNKITEAPITISKLVKAAIGHGTSQGEFKGPITDDLLMPILYYLFPDAVEENNHKYPEHLEVEFKQIRFMKLLEDNKVKTRCKQNDYEELFVECRMLPAHEKVVLVLALEEFNKDEFKDYVNHPRPLRKTEKKLLQGEGTLCGYVKTSPRDGLVWRVSAAAARLLDAGGVPYLAHLWYEFVQELQYRWEHRVALPGVAEGNPSARTCLLHQKLQLLNCCIKRAIEGGGSSGAGNSSEDEFFDCSEGEIDDLPLWDRPAGRLQRLGDATLKNGAPLYVPRTQDPAPKTEDQLEEDAELMVRLGDDARASELRARMMSASLLSDMEAFKAANPGAELCDFVQWYSPRDWKTDEGGSLGDRMLLPGNPWVEAWMVARPVPAARQRRLFDETREAEQVLHFLRSRTVSGVAELLLPAVLRAGALKAVEEGVPVSNSTVGGVDQRRTFEIAARELYDAEKEACRSLCLRTVLGDSVEGKPLDMPGRSRVLSAVGGVLPAPARREFTLRVRTGATAPQVMRAALASDMTIIGAFTERIVCL